MTMDATTRVTRVAVASERLPKLQGVRRALTRIGRLDPQRWSDVEIMAQSTESGVRATPLSDFEMQRGARNRAAELRRFLEGADTPGLQTTVFLGLEGGLHVEESDLGMHVWLRGWACAQQTGRPDGWGCGPSIELPIQLARAVLDGGDLAAVIDSVSGETDVRSRGGTWGILTRGLLARPAAFEAAVLAALAPFYNAKVYA